MKRDRFRQPFAKKSLGQNFLVDQTYISKIVAALDPKSDDIVVEIGPGRGAITEKIVETAGRVIAVELDRGLVPMLRDKFAEYAGFEIVETDALHADFSALIDASGKSAKLVANLPYYISTAILQRLIEQRAVFSEMVLMFQREVVERITARPGESERGFLTVMVEAYLFVEKLFDVPTDAFRPAPNVWSSVVRLTPKTDDDPIENPGLFRELVSESFRHKRKTLLNNLKNASVTVRSLIGEPDTMLDRAGIDPNRRAESLTIEEWRSIVRAVSKD